MQCGSAMLKLIRSIAKKLLLTIVLLVNDGNFGPVQEGHDILESRVQQWLCRVQVDGELLVVWIQVKPSLQVWDVKSVAYRVYVRP